MNRTLNVARVHLKFDVPKPMWLMLLMSGTMLAPNYPRIVSALLAVSLLSSVVGFIRENRAEEFLETLPVGRRDIIGGHMVTLAAIETIYILCMAVFDVIACALPFFDTSIAASAVGMTGTVAFFGVVFMTYGVFNLVFTVIYRRNGRTPSSLALGLIVALIVCAVPYGIVEALVQTVAAVGEVFTSFSVEALPVQFAVLFVGIALFVALSALGVFLSDKGGDAKKNVSKVNG